MMIVVDVGMDMDMDAMVRTRWGIQKVVMMVVAMRTDTKPNNPLHLSYEPPEPSQ